MKFRRFFSGHRLVLAGAALLLFTTLPDRTHAAFLFTLTQIGGNVVVTGSGSINTTGLALLNNNALSTPGIQTSIADLAAGPASLTASYVYTGAVGPGSFGTGTRFISATSGTGSIVGIDGTNPNGTTLLLPAAYASGTQLTDTAIFVGATFTSLGFIPGTYVYNFGSGVNAETLTVTGSVPEPSTLVLLGVGAAGLLLRLRRHVSIASRVILTPPRSHHRRPAAASD